MTKPRLSWPARLDDELRAVSRAIERLLAGPVSHTGLRAFCRSLDVVAYLAQDLAREEDVRLGDLDLSIEDARDSLEDRASEENGGHLASLIRQASARLRIFEAALASVMIDHGEDEAENGIMVTPDLYRAKVVAFCDRCGRILTDPQSVERGLGPWCWNAEKYMDAVWVEVKVIADDLAARVDIGEMEVWEALNEFKVRDQSTMTEFEDRAWERVVSHSLNGSDH